ncbi:MAG TPA: zinc ribbon domain-containing protein [Terriglobales bacterium]|nr:zinc ribbon domain-containing protein [Terriglobales bacterium]
MYCTSCGTPIAPQQALCSKCGVPTSLGVMQGGARRVAEHYRLLAILTIVYSSLILIAGIFVLVIARVVLSGILGMASNAPPPPKFVFHLIALVGWLILAKGAVGMAAGIGLLNRVPWARTLTLIVGFLSLLSIPIGTAIGIYTIWVLLPSGAEREYNELVYSSR